MRNSRVVFVLAFIFLMMSNVSCVQDMNKTAVVAKCDKIMKGIYNGILAIKNKYPELKDFGPQNLSHETPGMTWPLSRLTSIKISRDCTIRFRDTVKGESISFGWYSYVDEVGLFLFIISGLKDAQLDYDIKSIIHKCLGEKKEYSYYNKGRIAYYTKAIKENPNSAEAYCKRGEAYADEHEWGPAVSDFTKAIDIDPNYANAYWSRGAAYHEQQCLTCSVLAIYDYGKAIEIEPGFYYYNDNEVAFNTSKISLQSAIYDSTHIIESNPTDAKVYYSRGVFYYEMTEYDKAWADIHKAAELGYRGSPDFLDKLKKASRREK